jgi:membrane-associated protein
MEQLFSQIRDVFLAAVNSFFDRQALMTTLAQPEIMLAAFIAVSIIVFTETGLLIGFFLPGDSLLVTTGIVAWTSGWPVHWLIPALCVAAILGNSTGYMIGHKAGPRLFYKEKSFFFRKNHLLAAQAFYERHGGKTIVLAQFMPIFRTFAPVVAGIGRMNYRRFLAFNIVGAICWITSMIMIGYILTPVLEKRLKSLFGPAFKMQDKIEYIIIMVVLVSISPGLYHGTKTWLKKRKVVAGIKPQTPV